MKCTSALRPLLLLGPSRASRRLWLLSPATSRAREEGAAITEMIKGGRRAPGPSWGQGEGGREPAPPRPGPPAPQAEWCAHWPNGLQRLAHWSAALRSTRPRWRAGSRRAADRRGQRSGGMAGAGLRAAARRWLLCGGHGGPRAASSSPSCPGCGPPGPGAHCPSTPRSAPADSADLSAHLWARYQDMRRLVHGG